MCILQPGLCERICNCWYFVSQAHTCQSMARFFPSLFRDFEESIPLNLPVLFVQTARFCRQGMPILGRGETFLTLGYCDAQTLNSLISTELTLIEITISLGSVG